jgi:hypothetical protein
MSGRRDRRRRAKVLRHSLGPRTPRADQRLVEAEEVRRLAYSRRQAAEALGVSLSTLDRRVVPVIDTVLTEWGTRLIPVSELERYLAERIQRAQRPSVAAKHSGRRPGVNAELVERIRAEHAQGASLAEIARRLTADGVATSQRGRQWWPSTVRVVLARAAP